jgi:hypothetical protein
MTQPPRRPELPPDPARDHLKAVRGGLFRLHKALIDAARTDYEASVGPLSPGQFLQALLHEPSFEWLRPFSGLIVALDEALAAREPLGEGQAQALVGEVAALVMADDHEELGRNVAAARLRDPSIAFLQGELSRRIAEGPPPPAAP